MYLFKIHYGIWKVQNFIISCRNWAFVHWLYLVFHFITLLSVIYTYDEMSVESFRPWMIIYIFYVFKKKSMNFGLIDIKNQSSVLYLFFPIQSLPLVPSLLYYIWYSHCEFQVCYVNIQFQSSILVRQRSQAEVKVRIHIQFLKTWMYYVIYIYGVYVNLISKRIPRRSWRQYRDMCRSKWYQHGIKNHSYTCVRTKQGETTYSVLPFPWVSI